MLLLRGLTDLRFGAMAVAAYGAYELADQLGMFTRLQGVGDTFEQWLRGFPTVVAASLLAGLVAAVLAFSSATAALGNLLAFHGFRLTLRADALSCRFGLITTRQKTLPRARIQRVRVEQTWLRRLLMPVPSRRIAWPRPSTDAWRDWKNGTAGACPPRAKDRAGMGRICTRGNDDRSRNSQDLHPRT
jgi:hypothetical protein